MYSVKYFPTKGYHSTKKAMNQAKAICHQAVQDFEKSFEREAKQNLKASYSEYTKSKNKMKRREGIRDLIDSCGSKASSDSLKAEILNSFLSSVFTEENMECVPECKTRQCNTPVFSVDFTREPVLKKLKQLNSSKSPGPDGLHPCILKELAEELAQSLAQLFTESHAEGKLPDSWKDANVTPLFKKGDKSKPGNYCPVSLTSVVGKIMESIIKVKTAEHKENNNFLSVCQHRFIVNRSCTTNLLAVLGK